ncbi:hypothetical protein HZS55_06540 [Halosimplex rubrum]|uniref:Uncharacterized protein n=1 Tax=Halosimplex rubrum TaxID=869889 RepID=A0A7D5T4K5_9EURY|nr:hypothetical protein [Halosimplex rubrum]QLH76973.1 hypothetical protein HZS55_06540 [Halosimplex rubrum]
MARIDVEPFSESATYRAVRTLGRWAEGSVLFAHLDGERVLFGALAALVVVSVGSVFRSNLGSGVKFLSFALVFVCLAALTARFVDPGAE